MNTTPHESTEPVVGELDDRDERQWLLALHLSQLANFAIPPAGFVAPIVIWRMKRDESPRIDAHGRMLTNWIISYVAYFLASLTLTLVLIGFPMLWALGAVAVVFPIIGAVKAADGRLWKYPGTIGFL